MWGETAEDMGRKVGEERNRHTEKGEPERGDQKINKERRQRGRGKIEMGGGAGS